MKAADRFLSAIRSSKSRGRTKPELHDAFGYSFSHTAQAVNDLLDAGSITVSGKRGRSVVFVLPQNVKNSPVGGSSTSAKNLTTSK